MHLTPQVASAALRSNTVVLFLIQLLIPLFFFVKSLFYNTVLCIIPSFAIILLRKRELQNVVALLSLSSLCPATVCCGSPYGAMGWSAECPCGIF